MCVAGEGGAGGQVETILFISASPGPWSGLGKKKCSGNLCYLESAL